MPTDEEFIFWVSSESHRCYVASSWNRYMLKYKLLTVIVSFVKLDEFGTTMVKKNWKMFQHSTRHCWNLLKTAY